MSQINQIQTVVNEKPPTNGSAIFKSENEKYVQQAFDEMAAMKIVRVKSIEQIEAFLNEVSPLDAQSATPSESGTAQKISRGSIALFKTSKRRKHDQLLSEFEELLNNTFDELKVVKNVKEKLQKSVLVSHHEVMKLREQLKAVKAELSLLFDRNEIKAMTATLEASNDPIDEKMINEEDPYQMMIKFRRGRFGLWKRYKKDKHERIIAMCAYAVRDHVENLKDTVTQNDEYIVAINRVRDDMKSLCSSASLISKKGHGLPVEP